MNIRFYLFSAIFAALLLPKAIASSTDGSAVGSRSPENQVFQFMTRQSFAWGGGQTQNATAYLWIPPTCERVRGVVVMGRNVPEHWLVGHPAIRKACEDSGLALLWCCPSLLMVNNENADELGRFLQQILNALAERSGYDELRSVPWLPIGESMHLLMVGRLTSGFPERCIAGVEVKDGNHGGLKSPDVPILIASGTAGEWDQEKLDLCKRWHDHAMEVDNAQRKRRAEIPGWPGSLAIEGGSGHFECTEAMARLIAQYIRSATSTRLAPGGGTTLLPVDLRKGYLVGLPVPGQKPMPPTPYPSCPANARALPWYFDKELAGMAYDMTNVNWSAQTQIPAFADTAGKPIPFGHRGIFSPVPFTTADDGVTIQLAAAFLEKFPDGFVNAGMALGHAPGNPAIEWICGNVIPLGQNRFRIALDRTWPDSPTFLRVWHPGDANYRYSTQPGNLILSPNRIGKPQHISFDPIPSPSANTRSIKLHAISDAGLPVSFFVRAGPAEIHGDELTFSRIPPRSKMPLEVTVAAWQWGRTSAPAVQTAETTEQTFTINTRL